MQYWILKSEPDTFNFDSMLKLNVCDWDGVRNYQARNYLKLMKKGDLAFFYHTASEKRIVGLVKIEKEYFPDPSSKEGEFVAVKVKAVQRLLNPISIEDFKVSPILKQSLLLKQSRLSVIPVSAQEFKEILKLTKTVL